MVDNVVFYGAGGNMKNLLTLLDACGIPFNYPIWDINAEKIKCINGRKVSIPDFESRVTNSKVVITLKDFTTAGIVAEKLRNIGFEIIRGKNGFLDFIEIPKNQIFRNFPAEFTDEDKELIYNIKTDDLTMTGYLRLHATLSACKYVIQNNIEGDFVECGVWRGGQSILAASVFKNYGSNKKVWLFDTFEGFIDAGIKASEYDDVKAGAPEWAQGRYYNTAHCGNSLDDIKRNFQKYGVLGDNVIFIKGDVNVTLDSDQIPQKISVLRMDTDYYMSTQTQMRVLYPRLSKYGVLMEDDYDHIGVRSAIDEYFTNSQKPLFQYIDFGGRLAIKTT